MVVFLAFAVAGGMISSVYCCYKTFNNRNKVKIYPENDIEEPFMNYLKEERESSRERSSLDDQQVGKSRLRSIPRGAGSSIPESSQQFGNQTSSAPEISQQVWEPKERDSQSFDDSEKPFCKNNFEMKQIGFFVSDENGNKIDIKEGSFEGSLE